jgi:hypothetical protein
MFNLAGVEPHPGMEISNDLSIVFVHVVDKFGVALARQSLQGCVRSGYGC